MSDISAAAALSAAESDSQVASAIGIKMLKLINQQQANVAKLIDGAVECADQIADGGHVDIRA
jgi:hypothetical protein